MDIRIETPRLVLRPWVDDDVEQLVAGLNDLAVARWLAFVPHPYSTAHAEDWVRRCRQIARTGDRPTACEFAIEVRGLNRVAGGVSLNRIDRSAGTAGGGIWIAGSHQGLGYGREAFEAKIRFAFEGLGLARLVNGYLDGNERSWAMQRRLGYHRVGEVAAVCMADGRRTVEHVTQLTREDWEAREAPSPAGA